MRQLLIVAVALCAMPVAASAAPKKGAPRRVNKKLEAKKHINAATKAHQAEKFDVALTELQAAYELDPQPDLLYAIGQVQVKLDNCPEAIMSYEKFLESSPGPEPATAAQEAINTCREQLAAQLPPPPPPEPTPLPPPAKAPPNREGKRFYKDPLGDALVVAGVAAAATGVVFYVGARGKLDEADAAPTYAEHEALVDDAHSKRKLALIVGGAGVVVLSVGVFRWTRVGGSGSGGGGEQRVALVPRLDGGGMITWAGSF